MVKALLLAAWVILSYHAAEEYDHELRDGKVYAVHPRSGPAPRSIIAIPS
jgi:hypothetical protein